MLPESTLQAAHFSARPDEFPIDVAIVPGLSARVYLHALTPPSGPVWCWSFVTRGLEVYRQREVVFTVAIDGSGDAGQVPTDPLRFAAQLQYLAGQGRVVDAGGLSQLGGAGFLGRPGITYARAEAMAGVDLPAGALAAVLITAEEIAVYQSFGQSRLLALLGQAFRYYPFPPWADLKRASVTSMASNEGSLLGQIPRAAVTGAARLDGERLSIRLHPSSAALLQQMLSGIGAGSVFALSMGLDPEADGCLVWQAGQQGPSAITPPSSRGEHLAVGFLAVLPDQPADGGQLFEDGFAMFLTSASSHALREALASGRSMQIAGQHGKMSLSVEFTAAS
ncbi:MAG: hypothetical protein ABJE95_21100 [Byssovorax sp.]